MALPNSPSPSYAATLNGHWTPVSSTPTLDGSCDRANDMSAHPPPAPPLWPHRLSASFSAMADQIAVASQALALVPSSAFGGTELGTELGVLRTRLDGIEQTQARMMAEFEALKTQLATGRRGAENTNGEVEVEGEGAATDPAAQASKLEELEKKLNELSETVRLEQERLPVRLHNARATVMKATLKTPVAANGKPVSGFPSTRGEFEHITKERYEALLKAYGQPLKGDTAAKRDALRVFAGIPHDGQ